MRTQLPSTLAVLSLACALASGCERKAAESEATADADADAELHHRYAADANSSSEVPLYVSTLAVIESGAEPREELRYAALGSSRRLHLGTYSVRGDEERPVVELVLGWAGAATGDETFGYLWAVREAIYGGAPSGDEEMDAFTANLAKMWLNLRGQATGSSAGLSRIIQTRGARGTPSPAVQLYSFALPLPGEAVGAGAVWARTTRHGQEVGADAEGPRLRDLVPGSRGADPSAEERVQIERYTLVERQGQLLTIDYDMRFESDDPEAAPGQTASGRFVVSLADPVAQAGAFELVTPLVFPAREGREAVTDESRQRMVLDTI